MVDGAMDALDRIASLLRAAGRPRAGGEPGLPAAARPARPARRRSRRPAARRRRRRARRAGGGAGARARGAVPAAPGAEPDRRVDERPSGPASWPRCCGRRACWSSRTTTPATSRPAPGVSLGAHLPEPDRPHPQLLQVARARPPAGRRRRGRRGRRPRSPTGGCSGPGGRAGCCRPCWSSCSRRPGHGRQRSAAARSDLRRRRRAAMVAALDGARRAPRRARRHQPVGRGAPTSRPRCVTLAAQGIGVAPGTPFAVEPWRTTTSA